MNDTKKVLDEMADVSLDAFGYDAETDMDYEDFGQPVLVDGVEQEPPRVSRTNIFEAPVREIRPNVWKIAAAAGVVVVAGIILHTNKKRDRKQSLRSMNFHCSSRIKTDNPLHTNGSAARASAALTMPK